VEVGHRRLAIRGHQRRPLARRHDGLGVDEILRDVHRRLRYVQYRLTAARHRGVVALLGATVVGRGLFRLESAGHGGADGHIWRGRWGRVARRLHRARLHRFRLRDAAGDCRGRAISGVEVRRTSGEGRRWSGVAVVHGGVLLVDRRHLLRQ